MRERLRDREYTDRRLCFCDMEVIRDTLDFMIERPTAVCIGKFDGVHIGHRTLIEKVVACKAMGLIPTVFTFDPSPEELFLGAHTEPLCTNIQKQELLESLGIELVIEFPLTYETAAMEPLDFIENILVGQLHMRYIAAGPDISFGKDGAGDKELICVMGERFGYKAEIIEKVRLDGQEVSSSRIREALSKGDKTTARRMLGRS